VTTPQTFGFEGPSHTTLVFTSDSGERRTSEAWLPEGAAWEDIEDRIWCAFLRYSDSSAIQVAAAESTVGQSLA
jgi:hypothetical protein